MNSNNDQMLREKCLRLALNNGFRNDLKEVIRASGVFYNFIIENECDVDNLDDPLGFPSNYDEVPL